MAHRRETTPSCKKTDSPLLFTACYHGNASINHTSQRWPDPRFLPGSRKDEAFSICMLTLSLSLSLSLPPHPSLLYFRSTHNKLTNTDNWHRRTCAHAHRHERLLTVRHKHICMYVLVLKKRQFAIFCKWHRQHIKRHSMILFFNVSLLFSDRTHHTEIPETISVEVFSSLPGGCRQNLIHVWLYRRPG